jgi:serine/threonine-protein kinase SRPK3
MTGHGILNFNESKHPFSEVCRGDYGIWEEASEFEVQQGEMESLEDLLRGMLRYEPAERLTANQVMKSQYMDRWAKPAWEKHLE